MHVNKLLIALSLGLCAATTVQAQETGSYVGTVEDASCEIISTSSSTAGTLAGGTVGSVAGAVGANLLFGRKSTGLGALIGGIAGGYAGENMSTTRTYKCLIKARVYSVDKPVYIETIGQPYNIGQPVTVVKLGSGAWTIKP